MNPWERIDVTSWPVLEDETVGSEGGRWLESPDGQQWLHKDARVHDDKHVDGEDWAEVAATSVAGALRIPAAVTQLCSRNGRNGALSLKVHDTAEFQLLEGKMLLLDALEVEVADFKSEKPKHLRVGHSLENIKRVLDDVEVAGSGNPHVKTAFDEFVGFLCLDALVANQDRHEQNWAVLEPVTNAGVLILAPSYDHASAFGRNIRPEKRRRMLESTNELLRWIGRGKANCLEHYKPPGAVSLIDAAVEGLRLATEPARTYWIRAITDVDFKRELALEEVTPVELSSDIKTFIYQVLTVNQERLIYAADRT